MPWSIFEKGVQTVLFDTARLYVYLDDISRWRKGYCVMCDVFLFNKIVLMVAGNLITWFLAISDHDF